MHISHPLLEGEYTLIGPDVDQIDEEIKTTNKLQSFEFNLDSNEKIPDVYKEQDLVPT